VALVDGLGTVVSAMAFAEIASNMINQIRTI
jgi:hypothetical protein